MSKPSVSTATVQEMLQRNWGDVSELHPLTDGLTAQVFGFRHDAVEYVIRVSESFDSFRKDAFVSRRFASRNLPIPEIVEIGQLDLGAYYCISHRAPGVRLHDIGAAEMAQMVDPIVLTLAAISSADLTGSAGFGHFDAHGVAAYPTWRDFLLAVADPSIFDWKHVDADVDQDLIRQATYLVGEYATQCPELRCLIHGDFGSYNVLTNGRCITAVIDWDLALYGDPLYEMAGIFFWHEDLLAPLIDYFERHAHDYPDWRERMRCYQLHIGLHEIFYRRYDIAWLTERCARIIG